MEENKTINKKQRIYLIVGIVLFLILVLSASYAYFAITSVNNATPTTITGTGEELGTPTLTTNTTSLKLNLTVDLMQGTNSLNRIYATTSGDGIIEPGSYPYVASSTTPVILGNGRYKLATASVSTGNISYNCSYAFDVSATVTKTLTDGSGQDVHVIVTSPKGETYRYRLDELLSGTKTINGTISNLSVGEDQEFTIESYVYNDHMNPQNDLSDNTYTISVTPKAGTSGFSCSAATEPVVTGFAKNLIDSNKMKQTGLEGDGYRFQGTGTGEYCIYNNGKIQIKKTETTCPSLYNYIRTKISDNIQTKYFYRTSCPANTSTYTYDCTTLTPTTGNSPVDNYVCFGTTNKSDCTSNPDKYMYRVVGVFPDEYGNQHVKLLKNVSIGEYAWHNSSTNFISWHDSDLSKGLNGSNFYTNTTYDYMQNSTWRNKIENWRWTEATAGIYFRGNASSFNYVAPMNYDSYTLSTFIRIPYWETYLHEMNRSSKKYKTGYWTYTNAKIGIMNVSDYYLSLPIIDEVGVYNTNYIFENNLFASWLKPAENTIDWTMSNIFPQYNRVYEVICDVDSNSIFVSTDNSIDTPNNVRPVFYLTSDVEINSGIGTEADPYILK